MSEPPTGTSADDDPGDQTAPERAVGGATGNRRRRSRGGRGRNPSNGKTGRGPAGQAGPVPTAVAAGEDRRPDDLPDRPPPARPGGTSEQAGEAGRPKIGDSRPAPLFVPKFPPPGGGGVVAGGDGEEQGGQSTRRRRRRGGRGKGAGRSPAEGDGSATSEEEVGERRRGRERKGRPVGRYLMCVHVREDATQIAVLEGRSLIEHYVSRPQDDATEIDGNIYLGRVQNVLPGMEAAFVDIGTPKNAVLYRGDVRYDREDLIAPNGGDDAGSGASEGGSDRRGDGSSRGSRGSEARIEHLLRPGQTILCQVTKNPIGTKGARLTQEVSLPGRFVVLIPNSETYGISKRLPDEERRRLRRILDDVRPEGHGLIVRTAAEGATSEELGRDVNRLMGQWEQIDARAKKAKVPVLLYREPGMAVRVIREEFNADYRNVLIDARDLYEDVRAYVASITPELADRVEYFDEEADGLPLFERHHVHEQLHKALDRKVWLPSGGSIVIDRTEALAVIDVNTGKNVGKSSLEETVYRNNLEAAEEIARQLRLRDIGGIIVIDFIDMEVAQNRADVMVAFRDALARDKTRTQVFDISELGLVQMTRKRVSEGLVESFSSTCPTCDGRGIVLDETLL